MKIGILVCGGPPEPLRSRFGGYDDLFLRLLADRDFSFVSYEVTEGVLPKDVHEADGWLITGSRYGVYEEHPWIPPLEDFLRRAYRAAVPIVGICFGHQILAQALGGKVEKFSGGWSLGVVSYALEGIGEDCKIIAWHQDQVVEKPAEAEVVGSTPFCKYAALAYGDRAYSIQPHPEFRPEFARDLLAARRAILPEDRAAAAETSLALPIDSVKVADKIEAFFKQPRPALQAGVAEQRA